MSSPFDQLLAFITDLRQSANGCSWTKAQTTASLLPMTLEEVYEFIDAYHHQDKTDFQQELGDLLYHVLFYLVIEMEGTNEAPTVYLQHFIQQVIEKHEKRLPPKALRATLDPEAVNLYWQKQKSQKIEHSVLSDNAPNLPACIRANKLQRRAAEIGFDWHDVNEVFAKFDEELQEIKAELQQTDNQDRIVDEVGDLLFTCINLSRHLNVDPEIALHRANEKFIHRFQQVERIAKARQVDLHEASAVELEQLWQQAKMEC